MSLTFCWSRFDDLSLFDLHDALHLRSLVFVEEQACAYADVDGRDPDAWHLLARGDEGVLVAYLRAFAPGALREEAVIGRVVTAQRRKGLGTKLMEEGLRRVAHTWPGAPVFVSAQAHLADWYGRFGFRVSGPGYDEDGIPHVPMVRSPSP